MRWKARWDEMMCICCDPAAESQRERGNDREWMEWRSKENDNGEFSGRDGTDDE
jgi:hypothetical protein